MAFTPLPVHPPAQPPFCCLSVSIDQPPLRPPFACTLAECRSVFGLHPTALRHTGVMSSASAHACRAPHPANAKRNSSAQSDLTRAQPGVCGLSPQRQDHAFVCVCACLFVSRQRACVLQVRVCFRCSQVCACVRVL
jgi:hypothetical protein